MTHIHVTVVPVSNRSVVFGRFKIISISDRRALYKDICKKESKSRILKLKWVFSAPSKICRIDLIGNLLTIQPRDCIHLYL